MLVRKINKAKWFQIDINNDSDVSADAITNCLKTHDNKLSVWHIASEDDLDNAVLALVSNQDHLETIDIVILESTSLEEYSIDIIVSPGETPIEELAQTHRDLINLTYSKIGSIKDHVVEQIRTNHHKRYTKASLKKLIQKAVDDGILEVSQLKESIRAKI